MNLLLWVYLTCNLVLLLFLPPTHTPFVVAYPAIDVSLGEGWGDLVRVPAAWNAPYVNDPCEPGPWRSGIPKHLAERLDLSQMRVKKKERDVHWCWMKIQNPQNPKSKIPKIPKIQNPQNPENPKSKIPKIPKIQNPKSPKSQNPKSKIPKIQNPQNPKIQNPKSPKSKIQNPQNPKSKLFWPDFGDFGFWILDRYVAILYVRPPTPQILDFGGGFWILDFGDFGFWILDFGDFGFWILGILDLGFWGVWILDFGARIPNPKIQNPKSPKSKIPKIPKIPPKKLGFWILVILDFGFWGFWILDFWDFGDFGFWIVGILDFGFWILGILDFGFSGFWGFWILDFWNIM